MINLVKMLCCIEEKTQCLNLSSVFLKSVIIVEV